MFSDSNGAGNSKEQTEPRLACESRKCSSLRRRVMMSENTAPDTAHVGQCLLSSRRAHSTVAQGNAVRSRPFTTDRNAQALFSKTSYMSVTEMHIVQQKHIPQEVKLLILFKFMPNNENATRELKEKATITTE